MNLLNIRMHDGSRHFAGLPIRASWQELRAHLAQLPGAAETAFITDLVTESWLDFTYRGQHFSVNDQFGEFWFFVTDPACDDSLLHSVVNHFAALLGQES